MTNLDRILKSSDITLPTKVHLVKVMFFPVVIYRCESWTIKKVKHQSTDAFELQCWRTLLSFLDSKEIKPVNPKGKQLWMLIGRRDVEAELQYFGHFMWRAESFRKTGVGKVWGQEKGVSEYEIFGWHHQHNRQDLEQTLRDSEGQGSLVYCNPWGCKEFDMTLQLNKNTFKSLLRGQITILKNRNSEINISENKSKKNANSIM